MSRLRKSGIAAALAVSVVGGAEGLRHVAYPDPATLGPPWTICFGHTGEVHPGDRKSLAECKVILLRDLEKFATGVEACIKRPMSDGTEVAFVSFSYNVGTGAFCKSSVARLYNAGEGRAACDALMRFNRAAGHVMAGLTTRRKKERALCLEGLT